MMHTKPGAQLYHRGAARLPARSHSRTYWQFIDGIIRPFGEWELKQKKAALKVARIIGHFHKRSFRDL